MNSAKLSVPHIRQHQNGECVAACAAMVLEYLDVAFSYDQLLSLLKINWFGTAASRIRSLEKLGIVVIYKQGTLQELSEHLSEGRPCVAFVRTSELPYWSENNDHAVVVVGLDERYIYLNDPAFPDAPKQVSRGDFDLAWLERDEYYATMTRK